MYDYGMFGETETSSSMPPAFAMSTGDAVGRARARLCAYEPYWCELGVEDVRREVCSNRNLFPEGDPIRIALCGYPSGDKAMLLVAGAVLVGAGLLVARS
ncbi:MAG: hypothetical protein C4542_09545 [Dehalococcoidia bacterium]|nr:MAG: hypothetical protein C4542_09545 [Dehalococcoidia bacterium]